MAETTDEGDDTLGHDILPYEAPRFLIHAIGAYAERAGTIPEALIEDALADTFKSIGRASHVEKASLRCERPGGRLISGFILAMVDARGRRAINRLLGGTAARPTRDDEQRLAAAVALDDAALKEALGRRGDDLAYALVAAVERGWTTDGFDVVAPAATGLEGLFGSLRMTWRQSEAAWKRRVGVAREAYEDAAREPNFDPVRWLGACREFDPEADVEVLMRWVTDRHVPSGPVGMRLIQLVEEMLDVWPRV